MNENLEYNLEFLMKKNKVNSFSFFNLIRLLNISNEKTVYKILNYIMEVDCEKIEKLADEITKLKINRFPCKEVPISMDALFDTANIMEENGVDKDAFTAVLKLLRITDRMVEFELLNFVLTTNQMLLDEIAEELSRIKKK